MYRRADSLVSRPTILDRFSVKLSCKTTRFRPNKDGLGSASLSLGLQATSVGLIAGSPSSSKCWSRHPKPFSGSPPFHRLAWTNFHKMQLFHSSRKFRWQIDRNPLRTRDHHDCSSARRTFQGKSYRGQWFCHPFSKSIDIKLYSQIYLSY